MLHVEWLLAPLLAATSPSTGVNIHFTGAPALDLDRIRDAGFGWVRMDFGWSAIERERGVYRFDEYDALVDGLASRGIRALFILDYSNRLYEKDASVRTEEGRKAFARFAGAAAARYRGKGVRWEIWNEPNLEGFWRPQPAADDYAALVIEAARAIRTADPGARILAPASSAFPWPFLDRIFELGVLDHIDEVSVHPYRNLPPETVREDYARLRDLIARRLSAGRTAPSIVSGEWGYSTWHYGGSPMSAELQGAYLAREFLTNLSEGIPLSIWYDWANDGPDPRETEHNFGTVTQAREPKPAYLAARTLNALVGGASFERRLVAGRDDHFLLFRDGERRTLAAWSVGTPRTAVILHDGGRPKVTTLIGDEEAGASPGERLELRIDGRPRYVAFAAGTLRIATHGLDVEPLGGGLRLTASRSGKGSIEARLETRVGDRSTSEEVTLQDGAPARRTVSVSWSADSPVRVSSMLVDAATGKPLAEASPLAIAGAGFISAEGDATRNLSSALDGDAKVDGEAKLLAVSLEGEADAPAPRALRLDYRFGKGWRFVRVVPAEPREIPPGSTLSVWVKADGSGNQLRCRFRDAKGETFQPTAGALAWRGWRRVEVPLDGSGAGSWGGDGKVDPPIRWDTVLLIDSTREGGRGSVEFAAPVLVSPAE